jgi:ferritin
MISKTMTKALNDQMNEELYSFYLYLAMAAYLETQNLKGMAAWMRVQAQEELGHAMRFFDHLADRGGAPVLAAMKKPESEWSGPIAVFEASAGHERHISQCIHTLVDKARGEKDHASEEFLRWFVKEQVEEEATVDPIVRRLQDTQGSVGALYYMDHQLGKRGKE